MENPLTRKMLWYFTVVDINALFIRKVYRFKNFFFFTILCCTESKVKRPSTVKPACDTQLHQLLSDWKLQILSFGRVKQHHSNSSMWVQRVRYEKSLWKDVRVIQ